VAPSLKEVVVAVLLLKEAVVVAPSLKVRIAGQKG
jgi:hypothetical protein